MEVTETVSDGLKREFKVVVPAADLATKADAKIGQVRNQRGGIAEAETGMTLQPVRRPGRSPVLVGSAGPISEFLGS